MLGYWLEQRTRWLMFPHMVAIVDLVFLSNLQRYIAGVSRPDITVLDAANYHFFHKFRNNGNPQDEK
jgi:hypothetical protein